MFQTLDEFTESLVQGSWHADFFAPLHDRTVHEINFRLALGEDILQHAGAMLARGIGALLYQLSRIPMQFDAKLLRYRLALGDHVLEQLSRRRKSRSGSVMQQG